MKIAYLILAHTDPKQCSNLIIALSSESAYVFVYVDKKVKLAPFLESARDIRANVILLESRYKVYWSCYSLVAATIKLRWIRSN